jgi:hypothetical protein
MKILVKFPTRGRPLKFLKALNIYQQLRSTDNVDFLITIDSDDHSMLRREVINSMKLWGNLRYDIIEPSGKIGAINAGLKDVSDKYDIILLASDDMIPQVKGYDQIIIDEMMRYYPDTDGVLWFNDGYTGKNLNTLCILGTKYFRRFGYIYHPDYKSLWCDNEFMDVANMFNKQTYFDRVIIKHEHPIWTSSRGDSLNIRDNKLYKTDEQTYIRRKANAFDLTDLVPANPDITKPEVHVRQSYIGNQPTDRKPKRRRKSTDL